MKRRTIRYSEISTHRTRINAGLIGLSGNAPLTDNLRLYGNVAYGSARQTLKAPSVFTVPGDKLRRHLSRRGARVELHVSSRVSDGQAVRAASVSLGYRAQIYTVKSFPLQTTTLSGDYALDREARSRFNDQGCDIGSKRVVLGRILAAQLGAGTPGRDY